MLWAFSVWAGCSLLVLGLLWRVIRGEPRKFCVQRVTLSAHELDLPQMRLLHITDAHFHGCDNASLAFLARVAQPETFDLVLFTGDMIDSAAGISAAVSAAALFRPRLGAFAVLGGHDYARIGFLSAYLRLLGMRTPAGAVMQNPLPLLVRSLEKAGVRVLSDSAALLSAHGKSFAVIGLRDAFHCVPNYACAWEQAKGIPAVVISHSPDVLPEVVRRGARLALFGHTHGGQLRLPFLGPLITRSRLPRALAWGVFRHGGTVFIVNQGLGASPATPYRLCCPPGVFVVDLVASDGQKLTSVQEVRGVGT